MSGAFITLEGGEGAGKTTQASLLVQRLRGRGVETVAVREPGGTPVGDRVRDLLLDPAHTGLSAVGELLLYEASRAEITASVIRPNLDAGLVVVCDRFTDSTLAYQGYGRRLAEDVGMERIRALNELATGGLIPDLTVVLHLDPELALARATSGGADRLEAEEEGFHRRVWDGFAAVAAEEPERVKVVDASGSPEAVAELVWSVVEPVLIRLKVVG